MQALERVFLLAAFFKDLHAFENIILQGVRIDRHQLLTPVVLFDQVRDPANPEAGSNNFLSFSDGLVKPGPNLGVFFRILLGWGYHELAMGPT